MRSIIYTKYKSLSTVTGVREEHDELVGESERGSARERGGVGEGGVRGGDGGTPHAGTAPHIAYAVAVIRKPLEIAAGRRASKGRRERLRGGGEGTCQRDEGTP